MGDREGGVETCAFIRGEMMRGGREGTRRHSGQALGHAGPAGMMDRHIKGRQA